MNMTYEKTRAREKELEHTAAVLADAFRFGNLEQVQAALSVGRRSYCVGLALAIHSQLDGDSRHHFKRMMMNVWVKGAGR